MAISTYAELQASIANFLNRDDLTATIPDFIALAESSISNSLRHWRMETRVDTALSGQFMSIPSDWLATIRLHLDNTGTTDVRYLPRAEMQRMRAEQVDATGIPAYYGHNAGQFEVFPTPDGSYTSTLLYYAKVPTLSDSATTNWLLSNYPDIYLYGALLHSAPYLKEDERAQTWAALYTSAIERVNDASDKATASGSGLRLNIKSY